MKNFLRYLILFSIPLVILAIATLTYTARLDKQRVLRFIQQSLQTETHIYRQIVEGFLDQRKAQVKLMASAIEQMEGSEEEVHEFLRNRAKEYSQAFEALYLNDVHGNVVGTDGSHFNVADRPYFSKVQEGKTVVTEPIVSRASGEKILLILVPLLNSAGEVKGALGATILLPWLQSKLSNANQSPGGILLLLDKNGNVITSSDAEAQEIDFEAILESHIGSSELVDFDKMNVRYVGTVDSIKTVGWQILFCKPIESVVAGFPQYQFFSLELILFFSVVLIGLAGWLGTREIADKQFRLQATIDASEDGIWEYDLDSGEILWSESLYRILGYEPGEVHLDFHRVLELTHPEDRQRHKEAVIDHQRHGGQFQIQLRLLHRDGHFIWLDAHGKTIRSRSGRALFLGSVRDITAIKEMQDRLRESKEAAERSNSAKTMFLARVSHELRTPLHGICGLSEQLLDSEELSSGALDKVEAISHSSGLLLNLVNDLLDAAGLEQGNFGLKNSPFQLKQVFEEVLSVHRASISEYPVEITADLNPSLDIGVRGDRSRLAQILYNLLENAKKFTPPSGLVVLSAHLEKEKDRNVLLTCSVQDNGPGMSPEVLKHIFSPFYQDEAGAKKGGVGLGLSIVKQLITLMNGEIVVDSTPGVGSTFTFRVSLKRAHHLVVIDGNRRSAPVNNGAPLSVLVAEDNAINQKIVKSMFETRGHRVFLVENGEQAVRAFSEHRYDLVIMDLMMPVMDGITAARLIRKREIEARLRKTPIIAATAHAYSEQHDECLKAGIDAVVT
ncbi:MAG: response regulator, partial [Bdellovibrionales bacterium]|nr:response regulator [Bdellovibrionales bacterium]